MYDKLNSLLNKLWDDTEDIKLQISIMQQMRWILESQEKTDINIQGATKKKINIFEDEKWFNNTNYNLND